MKLGKYELVKKLATGGMAEIFLARQEGPAGFQKMLVVKRILPHLAQDERFVTMFLNEARLAALLNHPNIVTIYDLGEEQGSYFLAMEYIHGASLDQIVARCEALGRHVPLEIAARIIADACIGLDYAHKYKAGDGTPLGLVHRDVSPQNVLVTFTGLVKVVDFGVAKATTNVGKTQTGAVKGKYAYMSPEQIAGAPLDCRSDVFALGVVLYELATGRRPFGEQSDLMAVTAILNEAPQLPRRFVPDFPSTLEQVIFRSLEKDKARRYADAHEMQLDLERFIRAQGKYVTSREIADFLAELYGDQAASNLALQAAELQPLVPEDPTDIALTQAISQRGVEGLDSLPGAPDQSLVAALERTQLLDLDEAKEAAPSPPASGLQPVVAPLAAVVPAVPPAGEDPPAVAPLAQEATPAPQTGSGPSGEVAPLGVTAPAPDGAAAPGGRELPATVERAAAPPPDRPALATPAARSANPGNGSGLALPLIVVIAVLVLGVFGAGGWLAWRALGPGRQGPASPPRPPAAAATTRPTPVTVALPATPPIPTPTTLTATPAALPTPVTLPVLAPLPLPTPATVAAPTPPPVPPVRAPVAEPKPVVPAGPPATGSVFIQAVPEATVYIDGRSIGGMPISRQLLPVGSHVIKAVWPEGSPQPPLVRRVQVRRDDVINISLFPN